MSRGLGGKGILNYKTLPHVSGSPLLGNLSDFTKDRLGLLQRMARLGDACGIRFGPFPGILFNKPEHVQSILVKYDADFDKGDATQRVLRPAVGNGLLISEGAFHRQQRKLMTPGFQPRHIANYAELMGQYGERSQQSWANGEVIDIHQQMTHITMNIIGKTLFDADFLSEASELGAAMMQVFQYTSSRLSQIFPPPYHWPLPLNRRMHRSIRFASRCIQGFIDERRAQPDERDDMLSILLRARDEDGDPMSDEQVMSECLTIFGAGYETTASALSWTWLQLCQHPKIYQKVQQEVDRVLQGRTPTYADLAHLPYCLQVFKEAIRLYPPVYVVSRRALREVEIDGYRVPKDWFVLIAPYTLHRREEYFPDPETFDPERFTPEREKLLPRHAFMPFGAGPRVCLGLHFAMMESHLLLATLAQRASFALLPGQTIRIDPAQRLVIRPGGTLRMLVTKRSGVPALTEVR